VRSAPGGFLLPTYASKPSPHAGGAPSHFRTDRCGGQ
jgi:hypothetical protein